MLRYRSALLSLEGIPDDAVTAAGPPALRMDILRSLLEEGVQQETIEGIECISKYRWYIVFDLPRVRNEVLGTKIKLYDHYFTLKHPNPPKPNKPKYIKVRVYSYPLDSEVNLLEKAMKYYGNISEIRDVIDRQCDLKTGIKDILYHSLSHEIPSYVFVGRHQVRCTYDGQTKTCRKCQQTGHVARDCKAGKVCRVCGADDHQKATCPNQRCYHCDEIGHLQADCPQYNSHFPEFNSENTKDNQTDNPTDNSTDNPTDNPTDTTTDNPTNIYTFTLPPSHDFPPPPGEWGTDDWGTIPVIQSENLEEATIDPTVTIKDPVNINTDAMSVETKEGKNPEDHQNHPTTTETDPKTLQPETHENQPTDTTGEKDPTTVKKNLFKEPPPPKERREQRSKPRRRRKSPHFGESPAESSAESSSDFTPMNSEDEGARGLKRNYATVTAQGSPKKDVRKRSRIPISIAKNRHPFTPQQNDL